MKQSVAPKKRHAQDRGSIRIFSCATNHNSFNLKATMPELPEIKRYAYMINKKCKGLEFNSVSCSWAKYAALVVPWGRYVIKCTQYSL